MDKTDTLRREVDGASRVDREKRREGLGAEWTKTCSAATDLMTRISASLPDTPRATDPVYAAVFAMKDAALAARDAHTGVRSTLDVMITAKEVTAETGPRLTFSRGRLEGAWAAMRDAAKRDITPAPLKRAVETVERSYFTDYVPVIDGQFAAPAAHQALPVPISKMNAVADRATTDLDLAGNAALDVAIARANEIRAAAATNFIIEAVEFAVAPLLGVVGLPIARRRVARPLSRTVEAMRRAAGGDLSGDVPYRDRRDEIGAQIQAVRDATGGTVQAMEEIGRTIVSINEISAMIAAVIEEQNATTAISPPLKPPPSAPARSRRRRATRAPSPSPEMIWATPRRRRGRGRRR